MKYLIAFLFMATVAQAAEWKNYTNARFGASVELPPGFEQFGEASEDGDGLSFVSGDGKAVLFVWGNNILDNFKADLRLRFEADQAEGWVVSYGAKNRGAKLSWAVYSGTKGEKILYERSVVSCHGTQAVHFRLEYPRAQKRDYDSVVTRLGRSLKAGRAVDCQ